MKNVFAILLLLAVAQIGFAEEIRYISDDLRVPLRSSPGGKSTIIHRGIKSGTRLTILENSDEWSRVVTDRGTEGWLPSQYLVDQQVARIRIIGVEKSLDNFKVRISELQASLTEKEAALASLEDQLSQLGSENSNVNEELANLKQISSNAVSLHEQNLELGKSNKLLQDDVDLLRASNDQLKSDQIYTWFLYGALSVFLGALLTILIPRIKPKRRSSEWN